MFYLVKSIWRLLTYNKQPTDAVVSEPAETITDTAV